MGQGARTLNTTVLGPSLAKYVVERRVLLYGPVRRQYCIVFRRYRAEAMHVLGTQLICRHARRPQKVLHTTVVQSRLRRVPPPPFSSSHASMTKCYAARAR